MGLTLLTLATPRVVNAQRGALLTAVDTALRDRSAELPACVHALAAALDDHLTHEEDSALPLVQEVLTPADWGAFTGRIRLP